MCSFDLIPLICLKINIFRDITIFSGELEIENILTIGDIFDYNLSWDFEEREEGRQYPGIGLTRFSRIEVFGTF